MCRAERGLKIGQGLTEMACDRRGLSFDNWLSLAIVRVEMSGVKMPQGRAAT